MKISLWIVIGLIISAVSVSTLGAYFSIIGLGALFSGAVLAVWIMAGALELSKFVLAAYIHQRWKEMSGSFKYYLMFAIVVLSCITSLGIFGFLSDAYQSASSAIQSEQIRLDTEKNSQELARKEIERLTKAIDEVPEERVTKKMKIRAEKEPAIAALSKKIEESEKTISEYNLKIVEIHKKVGPLIYISRAFNVEIDVVVKYLILLFVTVFDPLAICLVIASAQALRSREKSGTISDNLEKVSDVTTSHQKSVLIATEKTPEAFVAEKVPDPLDPYADAEMIEMSFENAAPAALVSEDKKTS